MTNAANIATESEPLCAYCKLPIPKTASICTKCGSHQSKVRNELRYYASIIGLITALAAALTYVIITAPEVRKILNWKESLVVLRLSMANGLAIHNLGDGKVFVRDIKIFAKHYKSGEKLYSEVLTINKDLGAGDTLTHLFVRDDADEKISKMYWSILETDTDDEFASAVRVSGGIRDLKDGSACYKQIVYSLNDRGLLNYQESQGKNLRTYPVQAQLNFYSSRLQKLLSQEIQVVGVLSANPDRKCSLKR